MYRLWVPGPLPGMNEIIEAKATKFGKGKGWRQADAYSKMKQVWGERIGSLAREQGFPVLQEGHFVYLFREAHRRRDPSNFTAGGHKLIEDGLQQAGFLKNDGWGNVLSIQDKWIVDKARPGVTLFVTDSLASAPTAWWVGRDDDGR